LKLGIHHRETIARHFRDALDIGSSDTKMELTMKHFAIVASALALLAGIATQASAHHTQPGTTESILEQMTEQGS